MRTGSPVDATCWNDKCVVCRHDGDEAAARDEVVAALNETLDRFGMSLAMYPSNKALGLRGSHGLHAILTWSVDEGAGS